MTVVDSDEDHMVQHASELQVQMKGRAAQMPMAVQRRQREGMVESHNGYGKGKDKDKWKSKGNKGDKLMHALPPVEGG